MFAPHTVWSLEAMLRFHAATYTAVMSSIVRTVYELTCDDVDDPVDLTEVLKDISLEMPRLPVSAATRSQYGRLSTRVPFGNRNELALLFRELHNSIVSDLSSAYFLAINPDRRPFYQHTSPPFGKEVETRFQGVASDIAAASRCFALDEWTACVFHLMRVLEIGLRWLAADVGLPHSAVENENWKNVIDQIESAIRKLEALPKSQAKIDRVKFLSGTATQFRYFKDAWRNHVAHAHEHYDEREATMVWTHVRSFMEALAGAPSASAE